MQPSKTPSGAPVLLCGTDAACDDGDPCTADTCINGVCTNVLGGGVSSVLELTTDNKPGDTFWEISNFQDILYHDNYSEPNTLNSINMCLLPGLYKFDINDANGNGICCNEGSGGFKIKVHGKEVVSGGEFEWFESVTFRVMCSADTDCDDGNPGTLDTCAITSGTCQYVCVSDAGCDDGDSCTVDTCSGGICSHVLDCMKCGGGVPSVLELTTDNNPTTTSWNMANDITHESYHGHGYTDANTLYTKYMCLLTGDYTFWIYDDGDGICCDEGNGGYKIKVHGHEVVSGGYFYWHAQENFNVVCITDSDCDDGNSDTIDTCDSGTCQIACTSEAGCDDGDSCTVDTCSGGVCSNVLDCSICSIGVYGGVHSVLELTTDRYSSETA